MIDLVVQVWQKLVFERVCDVVMLGGGRADVVRRPELALERGGLEQLPKDEPLDPAPASDSGHAGRVLDAHMRR